MPRKPAPVLLVPITPMPELEFFGLTNQVAPLTEQPTVVTWLTERRTARDRSLRGRNSRWPKMPSMISQRHAPPTDEQLIEWSLDNPGVRFEYVNGEITVSPTTGITGVRQSALNLKLALWAKAHGYRSFGSTTLFAFADLKVSPDEVLILAARFDALSPEEQDETVRLVPDIAVELISKSQGLGKTRVGVVPKCQAMDAAHVGHVVMLDPYATNPAERVTTWGTPPPDFPTDWDDVLYP